MHTLAQIFQFIGGACLVLVCGFLILDILRGKSGRSLSAVERLWSIFVRAFWFVLAVVAVVTVFAATHTFDMSLRIAVGAALLLELTLPRSTRLSPLTDLNWIGRVGVALLGVVLIVWGAASV
jgi:uncharacterized membrane protein YesL